MVYTGERHPNWTGGESAYRDIMIRHNIPRFCKLCQTKDERILIVHHLDRNRRNNEIANLVWLCHNCHFLVHHYEGEKSKIMVPIA